MSQLTEFVTLSEKPKDWHVAFLKDVLLFVDEEKPSDRRATKYYRTRKVFDRRFIGFVERVLGLKRSKQDREQGPQPSEITRELLDAHKRVLKEEEEEAEKARKQ